MAPLKIGILVSSDTLPRWADTILQFIEKTSNLELCFVIQCVSPPLVEGRSVWAKLFINNFLYKCYSEWERRRVSASLSMTERVSLATRTAGLERIMVQPFDNKCGQRFTGEDLSEIESCKLDVIIYFGFETLEGEILRSARFGVWSICPGLVVSVAENPSDFGKYMSMRPIRA